MARESEEPTGRGGLSVAGFDPTGWAGLLADVGVFSDFGLGAAGAVTALTVQDLERVSEVRPVGAALLGAQTEAALEAPGICGMKIGMLGTGANAKILAEIIGRRGPRVVVLDPVLGSTGGVPLLDEEGVEVLRERLLPLCTLVTPNLGEARVLAGLDVDVRDASTMREAARFICLELGAGAVLVKGGHLDGAPADVLFDGREFQELGGQRLAGPAGAFHGTGCILSSAVAAGLIRGLGLCSAVEGAKRYTEKTLEKRIRLLGG